MVPDVLLVELSKSVMALRNWQNNQPPYEDDARVTCLLDMIDHCQLCLSETLNLVLGE